MTEPNLANLTAEIAELKLELSHLTHDISANNNAFFLVTMALIIFLMQCGFAFLEAGSVRSKNTTNILIKNLLDSCIAILSYWAIGWALAWGGNSSSFMGKFVGASEFFLNGFYDYPRFFFQFVFAATAATIVAGAVAERCQFAAYILYCTCISSIIYPILVHWGWSEQTLRDLEWFTLCGGTISFVAAYIMGPRIGRFPKEGQEGSPELQGHSVPFAALGGHFILMFCFLAFNGGSQADIVKAGSGQIVALAMINTIMSGASAAFTTLILHYVHNHKLTLLLTINACLAGMVAACAGANQMEPVSASLIGIIAAILYMSLSSFLLRIKVDDPLEATGVHFGGGFAGLDRSSIVYERWGGTCFQLGWTLICALAIILWSSLTGFIVFTVLKAFGLLRVSEEVEIKGLDIYMHGEAAYPLHAYGHGWDEFEKVKVGYIDKNQKLTSSVSQSNEISSKAEVSPEHLVAAYNNQTNPADRDRKISLYRNPILYEHPEHHSKSNHGNFFTRRNQIRPIAAPPIPEASSREDSPTHNITIVGSSQVSNHQDNNNHHIRVDPIENGHVNY
ncbi:Ammonium transporter [Aphelenchoides bicaudatus]|nr:Ammonium transporter [Aphelenchoides bicaudatus]